MTLPAAFLDRPIAHRALHDRAAGRVENSQAAIAAAIAAGYGIEIDLQLSADAVPMVFHDYDLGRLTAKTGPVAIRSAADLQSIRLAGDSGTIPTLNAVLQQVAGRVPLLIEIKDQDGALGPITGPMGAAVAAALAGYTGPVALMSFNPHTVAEMADLMPHTPRGLTTDPFTAADWPTIPAATRDRLRAMPDLDRTGASFISHNVTDLTAAPVAAAKARGLSVLCWTVRTATQARTALQIADNITFEGFAA